MTDAALAQPDAEPVADRIAELEREIYTLRANLVECADTLSAQQFNQAQQKRIEACRAELAALAQSDAEPVGWPTEPECRQAIKDAKGYIESSIFNVPSKEKTDEILAKIDTALAQSDAEPSAWQLVPIKPTKEMLDAADHAPNDDDWQAAMAKAYKVMLAVAPAPPRPDASAGLIEAAEYSTITNEARRYSLYNDIIENYEHGIRPVGLIDEFFGFPSMTAPPRDADRSGK